MDLCVSKLLPGKWSIINDTTISNGSQSIDLLTNQEVDSTDKISQDDKIKEYRPFNIVNKYGCCGFSSISFNQIMLLESSGNLIKLDGAYQQFDFDEHYIIYRQRGTLFVYDRTTTIITKTSIHVNLTDRIELVDGVIFICNRYGFSVNDTSGKTIHSISGIFSTRSHIFNEIAIINSKNVIVLHENLLILYHLTDVFEITELIKLSEKANSLSNSSTSLCVRYDDRSEIYSLFV